MAYIFLNSSNSSSSCMWNNSPILASNGETIVEVKKMSIGVGEQGASWVRVSVFGLVAICRGIGVSISCAPSEM